MLSTKSNPEGEWVRPAEGKFSYLNGLYLFTYGMPLLFNGVGL